VLLPTPYIDLVLVAMKMLTFGQHCFQLSFAFRLPSLSRGRGLDVNQQAPLKRDLSLSTAGCFEEASRWRSQSVSDDERSLKV
jgi:hypothetical protein